MEDGMINSLSTQGYLPGTVKKDNVRQWSSIRDKFIPQGLRIDTKDAIDRPFSMLRMRPYLSQYQGARETVYWVVALFDDGELANFTIGGVAACDSLDAIHKMNEEFRRAMHDGRVADANSLYEQGAGQPLHMVLRWMEGGQGEGYYTIE